MQLLGLDARGFYGLGDLGDRDRVQRRRFVVHGGQRRLNGGRPHWHTVAMVLGWALELAEAMARLG
jgi:hypothetical protein